MAVFDPRFECYAITDQASAQGRDDLTVAAGLIRGGATCLQYRAKKTQALEQWRVAAGLRALTREAGVFFVVNDRLDLALACGADGLHVGQDDLPLPLAREWARKAGRPDLVLGRSTHSLEQALAGQGEGADYIGFGPLFATQTKENNVPPVGLAALAEVLALVTVPVVAIGGIKLHNLEQIGATGARHCAIVTALTSAEDIGAVSRAHWDLWRAAARRSR